MKPTVTTSQGTVFIDDHDQQIRVDFRDLMPLIAQLVAAEDRLSDAVDDVAVSL